MEVEEAFLEGKGDSLELDRHKERQKEGEYDENTLCICRKMSLYYI